MHSALPHERKRGSYFLKRFQEVQFERMMTMQDALITSRDPKGRHAVSIFEAAYDKAHLDDASAQRLNERGDELKSGISKLLRELASSDRYANEEVQSGFTYPAEYTGPKPIEDQIAEIAEIFGLNPASALQYAENLPELPEGAEGWFAIPSVEAVARVHFPDVKDDNEQYCRTLQLVLDKIAETRKFTNWREGLLTPSNLRVHEQTKQALKVITETQQSDILLIPAQLGMRHRGRSVRRARECFTSGEFGLTSVAIGSVLLTHPKRLVKWDELDMDCAGDEFDHPGARERFAHVPFFHFYDGRVKFYTRWLDFAYGNYGSVSGFLPQ